MDENTVNTEEEALKFINKYGFVTLFPLRKVVFPNLYQATVGKDRKEKFDKAWSWADNLAMKKMIHYGKFVRKQVTLISLDMFPYFYKLYKRKEFAEIPQRILEYLRKHGATSTTDLRKKLDLTGQENKSKFAAAMDELQLGFAIAVVDRGPPPKMTYTWDLLERWMPNDILKKAESLDKTAAKERMVAKLFENGLISKPEDVGRLLGKRKPVSLMKPYKHHIFVCTCSSCSEKGAEKVLSAFRKKINEQSLADEVRVTRAGCLLPAECRKYGPLVVVYPQSVWYQNVTVSDVDRIIKQHLINGRVVSDLLHYPVA